MKCRTCELDLAPEMFKPGNGRQCRLCRAVYDKSRQSRSGICRNDTEAARERKRRYARKGLDKLKQAARASVRHAIQSGTLARQDSCEDCGGSPRRSDGITAVHAHHDDYSKPLSVRWLCAACHTTWHKNNNGADAAIRNTASRSGDET